jgi:hypothetical protein
VKRGRLVSAAPERPLGLDCIKPLFITWLAMGAYAVAISTSSCLSHAQSSPFLQNGWRGLLVPDQLMFVIFRSCRGSVWEDPAVFGWMGPCSTDMAQSCVALIGWRWATPIPYPNAVEISSLH